MNEHVFNFETSSNAIQVGRVFTTPNNTWYRTMQSIEGVSSDDLRGKVEKIENDIESLKNSLTGIYDMLDALTERHPVFNHDAIEDLLN